LDKFLQIRDEEEKKFHDVDSRFAELNKYASSVPFEFERDVDYSHFTPNPGKSTSRPSAHPKPIQKPQKVIKVEQGVGQQHPETYFLQVDQQQAMRNKRHPELQVHSYCKSIKMEPQMYPDTEGVGLQLLQQQTEQNLQQPERQLPAQQFENSTKNVNPEHSFPLEQEQASMQNLLLLQQAEPKQQQLQQAQKDKQVVHQTHSTPEQSSQQEQHAEQHLQPERQPNQDNSNNEHPERETNHESEQVCQQNLQLLEQAEGQLEHNVASQQHTIKQEAVHHQQTYLDPGQLKMERNLQELQQLQLQDQVLDISDLVRHCY